MSQLNAQNFDVDLSVETTTTINGAQGNSILGVYPIPAGAGLPRIPVGSDIELIFGTADPYRLDQATFGFDFEPCGHDAGIRVKNNVALPGTILRLWVVFGGGGASS